MPLLISSLLVHAERHHPEQEIVSRRVEGDIHRSNYEELTERARRMANALAARGLKMSDRIGTLAWNGYRHMELYYAVSGSGAVLHAINPRLYPDQIVYLADHAENTTLFFDSIPLGATGKMQKNKLREQFRDCKLPTAWAGPGPGSGVTLFRRTSLPRT